MAPNCNYIYPVYLLQWFEIVTDLIPTVVAKVLLKVFGSFVHCPFFFNFLEAFYFQTVLLCASGKLCVGKIHLKRLFQL